MYGIGFQYRLAAEIRLVSSRRRPHHHEYSRILTLSLIERAVHVQAITDAKSPTMITLQASLPPALIGPRPRAYATDPARGFLSDFEGVAASASCASDVLRLPCLCLGEADDVGLLQGDPSDKLVQRPDLLGALRGGVEGGSCRRWNRRDQLVDPRTAGFAQSYQKSSWTAREPGPAGCVVQILLKIIFVHVWYQCAGKNIARSASCEQCDASRRVPNLKETGGSLTLAPFGVLLRGIGSLVYEPLLSF